MSDTIKQAIKTSVFSLALLVSPGLSRFVHATEMPQAVIESAQRRVDYALNPGIALVYLEGDQPPLIKTFGKNSFATDAIAITPQSRFEIGSLTKVFTALSAAAAVETGQLQPKETLAHLWPQSWPAPHASLESVTLASLLSHTSGLPRLPDNLQSSDPTDPYANYSLKNLQDFFARHTLQKTPEQYSYSNLGFGLLGALLPIKTGFSSYAEMLEVQIWKPLKMNLTSLEDLENQALSTQPYFEGNPVSAWHMTEAFVGAGAIRSNAEDMAKFLSAQLNPPQNTLGQAIKRSHQILDPQAEGKQSLAYGWHVVTVAGHTLYLHDGQTGGYLSFMGFDPITRRGAVVLTNHTDAITDLGLALITPDYTLREIQDQRRSETELAPYLGQYELAPGLLFQIKQDAGYLLVQLGEQPTIRVFPEGKNSFKYRIVDARLVFKWEAGKVIGLTLHQNGEHFAQKK